MAFGIVIVALFVLMAAFDRPIYRGRQDADASAKASTEA